MRFHNHLRRRKIKRYRKIHSCEYAILFDNSNDLIEDIEQAMQPLFTTRPEGERSGMGFSFMEAFMDRVEVESSIGKGTTIHMYKSFQENILLQNKLLSGQV